MRVPVPGGEIAVISFGGEGRDILFVHSLGFTAETWSVLVPELGPGFRAYGVDLRGHGASTAQLEDPDQVWQDLAAVIEYLGLRRPIVVGHALGASYAIALALYHPGLIGALFLIGEDPFPRRAEVESDVMFAVSGAITQQLRERFGLGATGPDEASRAAYVEEMAARIPQDWFLQAIPVEVARRGIERAVHRNPDGSWRRNPSVETINTAVGTPGAGPWRVVEEELPKVVMPMVAALYGADGDVHPQTRQFNQIARDCVDLRVISLTGTPQSHVTDAGRLAELLREVDGGLPPS